MKDIVYLNVGLPIDLYEKARKASYKEKLSLAELIRQGLHTRLEKKEK